MQSGGSPYATIPPDESFPGDLQGGGTVRYRHPCHRRRAQATARIQQAPASLREQAGAGQDGMATNLQALRAG